MLFLCLQLYLFWLSVTVQLCHSCSVGTNYVPSRLVNTDSIYGWRSYIQPTCFTVRRLIFHLSIEMHQPFSFSSKAWMCVVCKNNSLPNIVTKVGSCWIGFHVCFSIDFVTCELPVRVGKGPSIYDVHKKKSRFWPPCPHASTWAGHPLPPCGRPHTVDMKYTPLSWNG